MPYFLLPLAYYKLKGRGKDMYGYCGGESFCYGGGYGYGYGGGYDGGGYGGFQGSNAFVLLVVLFILLIIVGSTFLP